MSLWPRFLATLYIGLSVANKPFLVLRRSTTVRLRNSVNCSTMSRVRTTYNLTATTTCRLIIGISVA